MKRILLISLLFLVGCGISHPKLGSYSIGRDPTWFPLDFQHISVNINGFTNALIETLSETEKKPFQITNVSWNQLFEGLDKGDYAGILSSLDPNIITESKYTFSHPFLLLGPVLVVPKTSDASSLADLKNTTIGAYQYDDSVLIIQNHPSIVIQEYQILTAGLENVIDGKFEGVLMPNLQARALVPTLYGDQLKIVTPPLSNKGLRLITLKGKHSELMHHFNQGLEELKEQSAYMQLRIKYGID